MPRNLTDADRRKCATFGPTQRSIVREHVADLRRGPVDPAAFVTKAFKPWCSGMMPRSLLSLLGLLLLCSCAPERCDKEIDRETAVRIARDYFLSRSIAELEAGRSFEQAEAKRMRRAGMTETIYRETFRLAEPEGARRIGNQSCGHPLIYYQAIKSLAYN